MINRAALMLRYKEPAVYWINEVDPDPESIPLSSSEVNRERTVYLVSDEDADTDRRLREWVQDNFSVLWESELEAWYTDESLWPTNITMEKFDQWFDVECHTVVIDTVDAPLIDDET